MPPPTDGIGATIARLVCDLGLTARAEFVPLSRSPYAEPAELACNRWRCLNWLVTLEHPERGDLLQFRYAQGEAHAPAWQCPLDEFGPAPWGGKMSAARDLALSLECELGRAVIWQDGAQFITDQDLPAPCLPEILQAVAIDQGAAHFPSFPAWAAAHGMSEDSRHAESIWREVMAHAVAIRPLVDAEPAPDEESDGEGVPPPTADA
jgi:hypothetical protein